jgi:hypothetical protein
VGHEGVRDEARGGAPLIGGAHNTSQSPNQWFGRRGGVSRKEGREHERGAPPRK